MDDLYDIAEKYNNMAHAVKYGVTLDEKKEYRRKQNKIVEMFKKELLEYLELTNHPKSRKTFFISVGAWSL